MNRLYFIKSSILTALLLISCGAFSQITVSGSSSVPNLVQNVLVGQGVTISNITPSGTSGSIGFFNGTSSNIGLDSGVVMATGGLGNVPPGGWGSGGTGSCSDADLSQALTAINMSPTTSLYNCTVIEFDFVPTTDSIQFQYVFASDEYPSYTCSGFNDIFGFFISGPGITGPYTNNAKNIALIPGTTTPVAINTLNSGVATGGSASTCYAANPNWVAHSMYFVNNSSMSTVGYPGFTVPLTAASAVQCGQTYHIKLAISDVGDGALNSAVFLKANSFTSSQVQIIPQINFGGNDSTLYETCGNATLTFTRNGDLSNQDTVILTTSGAAINGVDYTAIPDTIFFAPGQLSYVLNIMAIQDNIAEGSEILHLSATINNPCLASIPAEFEISITDLPTVDVIASADTTICPGDSALIYAFGTGGMNNDPLIYTWSNGYNGTQQYVNPQGTTIYTVTVTDSCGVMMDVDTVVVNVMLPIIANAGQDQEICIGDSTQLFASGSWVYQWTPSTGLSFDTIPNPIAQPTVTTTYVVEVSDGICFQTDTTVVTVHNLPNVTVSPADTTICLSTSAVLTGNGAANYSWSPTNTINNPNGNPVIAAPSTTTSYFIVGTDTNGCKDFTTAIVRVNPPLYIEAYGDTSVCAETISDSLTAYATGGNGGPYTYTWSPSNTLSSSTGQGVLATPFASTAYTVTVTDNCGTPSATDTVQINVFPLPEINITLSDSQNCTPLNVKFTNNTTDAVSCLWRFDDSKYSEQCSPSHTYNAPGTYFASLIVENSYGCRDTLESIRLNAWPVPTAKFSVDPPSTTILNPVVNFKDESWANIVKRNWEIGSIFESTLEEFQYTFPAAGSYPVTLTVENGYGCTDQYSYTVVVKGEFVIFIPNAFTPDDNGRNDIFKAEAVEVLDFNMKVYNRWGEKIFESNSIEIGWDGTYKGVDVEPGVYIYTVEAEGIYPNSQVNKNGTITLVR